jgi:protein O-mannosyl-transferase
MTTFGSERHQMLFLICITILFYIPSLAADFVFDDHYLIQDNPHLRSVSGLGRAFTQDYYGQVQTQYALGYYRPFSILTHWLDWQIWKNVPFGHHLTNVIIHLCVVLLLYVLNHRLFENRSLAFLCSVIFALHPSHVSTVTFISGRVDALAAFLSLLTLFIFLRKKMIAPVSYFSALLCKEIAVTTPVLVFWKEKDKSWRSALMWMIPFAAVLIVIVGIRWKILGNVSAHALNFSFSNIVQALLQVAAYLRFLILPPFELYLEPQLHNLSMLLNVISAMLFVAGLIFLKNSRIASWCAIWLFTLIPVLGFIQIETKLDERFLYLPSISFCLLLAAWLLKYLQHRNRETVINMKQILVLGALIAFVYAPILLVRESYWKNDLSLWRSALITNPSSATVHFRLGVAEMEAGLIQEAEEEFNRGLQLPQETKFISAALYTHLAVSKQLQHKSNVEDLYKKAIAIIPMYFSAHFNLGLYYKQGGQSDKAIQEFETALKINPDSAASHRYLAELYKQQDKTTEAKDHLEKAQKFE